MHKFYKLLSLLAVLLFITDVQASGVHQGDDIDAEVGLLPAAPAAPVFHFIPPDHNQGEWHYEAPANVDPAWLAIHRARVKSRCLKLGAGMVGCLVFIGAVLVVGIHEGPTTVAVNATETGVNCIGQSIFGWLYPWLC